MSQILIVEDVSATAWAVAESLRDDGHEIETAASAEDALEWLKGKSVDLVITDVRLPGMSGIRMVKRLRAGRRRLPVIVLTAYGTQDVLDELESCDVYAVFDKPFRVDQLRRSVREALVSEVSRSPDDTVSAGQGGDTE
jgi:two-component system response regulator (stage 0 sporulation protein F)